MAIDWSGNDEPPPRNKRSPKLDLTMLGLPMEFREGTLPSARKPRDVLVVAIIALAIIVAGLALWVLGPLPRVFPLMS